MFRVELFAFKCMILPIRYRNFLMSCTALYDQDVQPEYFPLLDSSLPPRVRNLQKWIDSAWKAGWHTVSCLNELSLLSVIGFDEEGASQLNHKIIDTQKWIGAAGTA